MIAELRTKSQITIPKSIIDSLNLSIGDKLDISENNGVISIIPVTVYPKSYIEELQNEVSKIKEDVKSGKKPTFSSIDSMLSSLE